MMALIRAEFVRYFGRRATWIAIALGFAASLMLLYWSYQMAVPPSEEVLAQAQKSYEEMLRQWEQGHAEGEPKPTLNQFIGMAAPLSSLMPSALSNGGYLALMVCLCIAATVLGAEFATGAIANQLVFAPNRTKVWAAKGIVTTASSAFISATLLAWIALATWGLVAWTQGISKATGTGDSLATFGRMIAVAVIGALLGFAFTAALRSTAAAIGIVLGYGVFGSAISELATRKMPSLLRVLPDQNLLAIISGRHEVWLPPDPVATGTASGGRPPFVITFAQASLYWVVLMTLVLVASWFVFRRRDIT